MTRDDDPHRLTEADRDSDTRFGPRPVPKGHRTASPYPHRPMRSSRIIPSAPMSPDGRSAYPTPALSSKIIVWGGVALGVAGLTAGTLLALRKLSGGDTGGLRARPGQQNQASREAVRPTAESLSQRAPRATPHAARKPSAPSQRNIAHDLTRTATDLSASLNGVAQSVLGAVGSFRKVAMQAGDIMAEFSHAAEQVRAMTGRAAPSGTDGNPAPADRTAAPRADDAH